MFWNKKVTLYLLVLLVSSYFLSGCAPKTKTAKVDFNKTVKVQEEKKSTRPELNIGIGSMITPDEGYIYYRELLEYIGRKLGRKVNFVEKGSYQAVNALLEAGRIDVAFVCGGPYVDGHSKFDLELLVAPQVDGKAVYYSYIITRKGSQINSLSDLRGKTFVFADPLSNTGRLVPTFMLAKMGEKPETFFKDYVFSYGHDKSIKAVALGIADGAAVDSLIWEYLSKRGSEYAKKTKIIKVSKPYGIPPVVVRPALDKRLKAKVKKILLEMHEEEPGREILSGMAIDKFVVIRDSKYDSIRKIKNFLKL
jgi:phosphonate transport system substrate-binding protein